MRKIYLSIVFVLAAVFSLSVDTIAQVRYVDVVPGIGTLNDAINGDTATTGERIDPENTVYRLQRGPTAYYGLTGTISNSGFPLTIVAEDGDGARPFLQPRVVGDASSGAFRPRADITLIGLHVTNVDELGGYNTRMLRCSADDLKVTADDCWFDKASQSFIRTDNPGQSYYISNCIISNIGQPTSPDNGRGIDDRGNDIDTVFFENCTFYNLTSRIIRDGGGKIGYAHMNKNTIVNIGQWGITFGPTEELVVTNNLSVNAGFLPKDDDSNWVVFSVDSVGDVAPDVTMMNNSAYLDTTMLAPYLNDTTTVTPLFNPTLAAALIASGTAMTNMNLEIQFADGPPFNDSMLVYLYNPDFDPASAPDWEEPEVPTEAEGGNGIYHLDVPYDFAYIDNRAVVAATDGQQLGDRRWTADRGMFEPVDFENPQDRLFWGIFANGGDDPADLAIIPNPDPSGINTSSFVARYVVQSNAEAFAGAFSNAVGYMEFTQEKHHMEMMVWKDKISQSGLKVEDGDPATEVKVPNTVTGEWELLTFDFSANIGSTMKRLVFFPDFTEGRTEGATVYIDNINIVEAPVGVENDQASVLRIYPNPVTDQMIVRYPGMTQIVVRDVLGKTVRSLQLQGEDHTTLSVNDLNEGIYFITVGSERGTSTTKFLKR